MVGITLWNRRPVAGDLAIIAVILAEFHFGVLVTKDQAIRAERLRRLSHLQRTFDAPLVDEDVATSYGELAAALATSGKPVTRVLDLLIAAAARGYMARLYTRNPRLCSASTIFKIVVA